MMKKRTAQSQTARLGVNLVERRVLEMGWIWREQPIEDFGIDGQIEIAHASGSSGFPANRLIAVQIKAGLSYLKEQTPEHIVLGPGQLAKSDLAYWKDSNLPVILVVCDTTTDTAYYRKLKTPIDFSLPMKIDKASILCVDAKVDLNLFALTHQKSRAAIGCELVNLFRAFRFHEIPDDHMVLDGDKAASLLSSLEPLLQAYFSIPLEFADFIRPRVLDRSYETPESCQRIHTQARWFQRKTVRRFAVLGQRPLITLPLVDLAYGLADYTRHHATLERAVRAVSEEISTYLPLLESNQIAVGPRPVVSLLRYSEGVIDGAETQFGRLLLSSTVELPVELAIPNEDILTSARRTFPWAMKLWEMGGYGGPYIWGETGPGPMLDFWLRDAFDMFFEYACLGGFPVITCSTISGLDASLPDLVIRSWERRCNAMPLALDGAETSELPELGVADETRLTEFLLRNSHLTKDIGARRSQINELLCAPGVDEADRVAEVNRQTQEIAPPLADLRSKLIESGLEVSGRNVSSTSFTATSKASDAGLTPSLIKCLGLHLRGGTMTQILKIYAGVAEGVALNPSYGANVDLPTP